MTEYCEVAVPVPLDQLFTYKLDRGISTEAGARVVVPFRERRLIGIVTELHDRAQKQIALLLLCHEGALGFFAGGGNGFQLQ